MMVGRHDEDTEEKQKKQIADLLDVPSPMRTKMRQSSLPRWKKLAMTWVGEGYELGIQYLTEYGVMWGLLKSGSKL